VWRAQLDSRPPRESTGPAWKRENSSWHGRHRAINFSPVSRSNVEPDRHLLRDRHVRLLPEETARCGTAGERILVHLDLVDLTPLMARTAGRPDIVVGLIDGPVAVNHRDLTANIRELDGGTKHACANDEGTARLHGTYVAGILSAKRGSFAPAICPDCTLLVRPVFSDRAASDAGMPRATPRELAIAIVECINAGADMVNLSLALEQPSAAGERELESAIDYAVKRSVVIVAAAGNQGTIGSSALTRHPWVIPVVSYDLRRAPMPHSNFAGSIGTRGLGAPGDKVTSIGADGEKLTLTGTSSAAPFVTGTIALLSSEFPKASMAAIRFAVTQAAAPKRTSVVPPLLNAWAAFEFLDKAQGRR
jgi:subtilisin family serine protease